MMSVWRTVGRVGTSHQLRTVQTLSGEDLWTNYEQAKSWLRNGGLTFGYTKGGAIIPKETPFVQLKDDVSTLI